MDNSKFEKCLEVILAHEGGHVNHPKDPGGETNLGVTKKVYEEFGGMKDMRALTIDDVKGIYKKNYWDKVRGDNLPLGLDLCVFDFGVNAGIHRASKMLQHIIGATTDGVLGSQTLKSIEDYLKTHTVEDLIEHYQQDRHSYYRRLNTFDTFGKGWSRRVDETTEIALSFL